MLHGSEYFPPLSPAGDQLAQVVISSPEGGGSGLVQQMYLLSLAAARTSVLLATAYFVPDQTTHDALLEARKRGVDISILVPGERIDVEVARAASRSAWGPLLQAGVRIYEYEPTMYHNKLMIVDGLWVSIGSSNLDNRSFKLNDEANLNVYDADLAAILAESFYADLKRAREVTIEDWEKAPLIERILEHAASLISGPL
jgi:cardiolipin synthase